MSANNTETRKERRLREEAEKAAQAGAGAQGNGSGRNGSGNGYALKLDGVRKVYPMGDQEVVALDGIDLTVGSDEIVALVGPSGSGKTTLCTIAGGILSASDGAVSVGGEDITEYSAKQLTEFRRTRVGFVFQSVNLVPFLTARENLQVVAELGPGGLSRSEARERADELLEELGLGKRGNNLPGQLSGGQKQRVAIGRALMNSPELVLFDEPTSALDSKLGDQVVKLIRDEMKQRGTAAIIVTHDDRITHYADRTVRIEDGRIVDDGNGLSPDRPKRMLARAVEGIQGFFGSEEEDLLQDGAADRDATDDE